MISLVVIVLYVPETKGKSRLEIEGLFNRN
jgi:hypothetical protein